MNKHILKLLNTDRRKKTRVYVLSIIMQTEGNGHLRPLAWQVLFVTTYFSRKLTGIELDEVN